MIIISIDKKTATISIQDNKFHCISKDATKWISEGKEYTLNQVMQKLKQNL